MNATNSCALMDELRPEGAPHKKQIQFVKDRPGHDWRYAIDASKIKQELGFVTKSNFRVKLLETVVWFLNHESWWQPLLRKQSLKLG